MSEAYVALTRAVSAVHCVFGACGPTPPTKKNKLGGLLSRAYESLGEVWAGGEVSHGVVWALGDQGEFTIHTSESPENRATNLTKISSQKSRTKAPSQTPPSLSRTPRRGIFSAASASQQDESSDWSALLPHGLLTGANPCGRGRAWAGGQHIYNMLTKYIKTTSKHKKTKNSELC